MSLTGTQNAIIDDSLRLFQNEMEIAGFIAWQQLEGYFNTLETDEKNHVLTTPYNSEVAEEIPTAVFNAAQSTDYVEGVEAMKAGVDEIAEATRQYYATQDVYLQTTAYNYDRMLKGLQTTIKNEIDAAFSFEALMRKVSNPAYDSFFSNHAGQGSTKQATINDMQHRIEERFYNFSVTASLTIMQQYARRVNEIFAQHGTDELIWVMYEGKNDHLTREFCLHYLAGTTGKIYHVDEVKQWTAEFEAEGVTVCRNAAGIASNDGLWCGAIPNTDQNSIFVNAGGFNCRHSYVYMTQREVAKQDPNAIYRAEQKGLSIYYRNEN